MLLYAATGAQAPFGNSFSAAPICARWGPILRKNELVLAAMSLDMFAVLFGGAITLLPIYAVEILHTDARGLGWLRAAPSLGAVTMALLQTHTLRVHKAGAVLLWSVAALEWPRYSLGSLNRFGCRSRC